MYDIVKELIGALPTEFEFVYVILTLVLGFLLLSLLFSLFYVPMYLIRGK